MTSGSLLATGAGGSDVATTGKLAQRLQHTGVFAQDQAQRLAQDTARKSNAHVDMLAVLTNRAYTALAADVIIGAAAYAPLLTANITTTLAAGFLIITWSVSTVHPTAIATTYLQVVVDGVVIKGAYWTAPTAAYAGCLSMVVRVPVTRGAHVVQLQWKTDGASARISAKTINEEHAHMLVQEAA